MQSRLAGTASRPQLIDAGRPNQTVEMKVYKSGTESPLAAGIIARATDASNFYLADISGSNSNAAHIYKCVGGVYTQLGIFNMATAPVVGDVISLTVNGSSLTLKRNGTTLISLTDTSITIGNKAGIWQLTLPHRFEDFKVTHP